MKSRKGNAAKPAPSNCTEDQLTDIQPEDSLKTAATSSRWSLSNTKEFIGIVTALVSLSAALVGFMKDDLVLRKQLVSVLFICLVMGPLTLRKLAHISRVRLFVVLTIIMFISVSMTIGRRPSVSRAAVTQIPEIERNVVETIKADAPSIYQRGAYNDVSFELVSASIAFELKSRDGTGSSGNLHFIAPFVWNKDTSGFFARQYRGTAYMEVPFSCKEHTTKLGKPILRDFSVTYSQGVFSVLFAPFQGPFMFLDETFQRVFAPWLTERSLDLGLLSCP